MKIIDPTIIRDAYDDYPAYTFITGKPEPVIKRKKWRKRSASKSTAQLLPLVPSQKNNGY